MSNASLTALRPTRRLLLWLVPVVLVASCGSEVASPSPPTLPSSPPPAIASPSPAPITPARTPRPTRVPWPAGWDEAFCTAFAESKIVQELVVDVPRALADDERREALALARELRRTANRAEKLLGRVGEWEEAQPVVEGLTTLADFGRRIARQYVRFLDDGRRASRRRAGELSKEMRPIVATTNGALADLRSRGLQCPDGDLELESP